MKRKNIYRIIITMIIISSASILLVHSQPPAPPPEHGLNGDQGAGGTAPIDSGSLILLLGGLGYGGYKVIRNLRGKGEGLHGGKVVRW